MRIKNSLLEKIILSILTIGISFGITGCSATPKPNKDFATESFGFSDPKAIENHITKNKQDPLELIVNASRNNQIIGIGEEHFNYKLRKFVGEEVLPALDNQGYNFLALEIQKKYQKLMDDFLKHGKTNKNARLFTENIWIDRNYEAILENARNNKWKVICIDTGDRKKDSDYRISKNLKRFLDKNKGEKGLVYYGRWHTHEGIPLNNSKFASLGAYINQLTAGKYFSIDTISPEKAFHTYGIQLPDKTAFLTAGIEEKASISCEIDGVKSRHVLKRDALLVIGSE